MRGLCLFRMVHFCKEDKDLMEEDKCPQLSKESEAAISESSIRNTQLSTIASPTLTTGQVMEFSWFQILPSNPK